MGIVAACFISLLPFNTKVLPYDLWCTITCRESSLLWVSCVQSIARRRCCCSHSWDWSILSIGSVLVNGKQIASERGSMWMLLIFLVFPSSLGFVHSNRMQGGSGQTHVLVVHTPPLVRKSDPIPSTLHPFRCVCDKRDDSNYTNKTCSLKDFTFGNAFQVSSHLLGIIEHPTFSCPDSLNFSRS